MIGTFAQYGRTYHLLIRGAEDLDAVEALDDALWVATGAPIDTIRADAVFLGLLDLDSNGRIMCFEVRAAVRWLKEHLRSFDGFDAGRDELLLDAVGEDGGDGQRISTAARKIADRFGTSESITLRQIRTVKGEAEARPVSEHGVVLPEASEDLETRELIEAVVATLGGVPHPGGAAGVDDASVDAFLKTARQYLDWREEGQADDYRPLGAETDAAYELLSELEAKVEQFFALSSALEVDPGIADRLKTRDEALESVDANDAAAIRSIMAKAPLAAPASGAKLPLGGAGNPYYRGKLAELKRRVVEPILGAAIDELAPEEWGKILSRFASYEEWRGRKPDSPVTGLSPDALRRYIESNSVEQVRSLIDHAEDTAILLDNVRLVEKLSLYQTYLLRFVNNFVSFPQLYDWSSRALFEMGTLTMDGRHFNFAVKVVNRAAHRAVAATSSMFVLYVRVQAKAGVAEYEVAVPVTDGGKKNLTVGKRGLFHDVGGTEYDAEVVEMIENPISVVETIAAPFRRIANLITKKIESLTVEAQARLDTTATDAITTPAASAAPAPRPAGSGGSIIAGSGVAIAAVGTAATYFASTISALSVWRVLLGLGAAVAAVIIPMTALALIKLRKRDLSAILEGSGWAINLRMRLTRAQARYFTQTPRLPLRSRRIALKRVIWTVVILSLVAAGALVYWIILPLR